MRINNVEMTAEEARIILADERLILASREEVEAGEKAIAELASLRGELATCREENAELRIALENHNSGSKQLAKWLEESRMEAMDAKRQAASARARVRMMRDDLGQLLEGHRKNGITSLFLALEELIQETK